MFYIPITYFPRKNPTNRKSVKKFRVIAGVRCMSQIMFVMKWGRKNANWIIVPFRSCGVISDHCAVCMVQLWTLASLNPDFSKVLNIPMLPQPLAYFNLLGFKLCFVFFGGFPRLIWQTYSEWIGKTFKIQLNVCLDFLATLLDKKVL